MAAAVLVVRRQLIRPLVYPLAVLVEPVLEVEAVCLAWEAVLVVCLAWEAVLVVCLVWGVVCLVWAAERQIWVRLTQLR